MSRGMLSLTLHRTAIPNPGALTLRCNSSALILFADWKRLVFRVDTFATTTFSIVDGARHGSNSFGWKQEDRHSKRAPTAETKWESLTATRSVPAAATVKASTTKYDQNEKDDQKSVGIHSNSPGVNRTGKRARLRTQPLPLLASSATR
jgi:hypothetical protein